MKKITILGAGITGLDLGWQLIKKGFDITIIDKSKFVGGLATTLEHKEYKIDIGPHYVALPNSSKRIKELKELIGKEEIKEITVSVKVWFYGKIVDQYPTLFDVMFRYGINFSVKSISSFLKARIINKINNKQSKLAIEYCKNTYGNFLYNIWFEPRLIRKFGNVDKILVNDALDMFPEISSKKLFSFLRKRSSHIVLDVDYSGGTYNFYCENGMGILADKLKQEILKKGGKILLNTEIISIDHSESKKSVKINHDKEKVIFTDKIIYAIPPRSAISWFETIPDNIKKMPKSAPPANAIMVFLFIDSKKIYDGWIVDVFDPSLVFFRIAQQNYLSKSIAPKKKTLLSVEIRATEDDDIWKAGDDEIVNRIKNDLQKMNILKSEKIDGYKLMKMPKIYPVLNPAVNHEIIIEFINSFKNEYTLGTQIADPGTLVTSKRKDEKAKNAPIGLTAVLQNTPLLVDKIISEDDV